MKTARISVIVLLGIMLVSSFACGGGEEPVPTPTPTPTPTCTPAVAVMDYDVRIYDVAVDKLYVGGVTVLLRNEGDASATVNELIITSDDEEINGIVYATLDPGEEEEITYDSGYSYVGKFTKLIGIEELAVTITIMGYPEGADGNQILVEENIAISVPKVSTGDAITDVRGKQNLSITLLSWEESPIAVDGPYASGYYTFTARPGMKFIVLIYRLQNNGIREQGTPYINAGEIATDIGYIYSVWTPPLGVSSEEYNPRKATEEEVDRLIGDSGAYEDLLPEESITGCVVFEIPADATPIEASIASVPFLIEF